MFGEGNQGDKQYVCFCLAETYINKCIWVQFIACLAYGMHMYQIQLISRFKDESLVHNSCIGLRQNVCSIKKRVVICMVHVMPFYSQIVFTNEKKHDSILIFISNSNT